MSVSLTMIEGCFGAAGRIDGSGANLEFSGGILLQVDEDVADSETDYELTAALDVSEIAAIAIMSTADVLLEINDGAGGGGSVSLVANKPLLWDENSYYSNLFGTDWTSIFITTAAGAATIRILAVGDPTP